MNTLVPQHFRGHRITNVGKDLQDYPVQLITYHQYFSTKPCPSARHLNSTTVCLLVMLKKYLIQGSIM